VPCVQSLCFDCLIVHFVCVCVLSHWVHAAIAEVQDLPSLKCSSHWSLRLYPASAIVLFVVVVVHLSHILSIHNSSLLPDAPATQESGAGAIQVVSTSPPVDVATGHVDYRPNSAPAHVDRAPPSPRFGGVSPLVPASDDDGGTAAGAAGAAEVRTVPSGSSQPRWSTPTNGSSSTTARGGSLSEPPLSPLAVKSGARLAPPPALLGLVGPKPKRKSPKKSSYV
jgi:hypothetical protein